ncbi:MAG: two-component regulator propeller domain-containing protein [Vicinamibacteria bacterium]
MSVLAAVVLAASVEAVTSAAEVRACRPLPDGRVLAATSGGLVLYTRALDVERVWTALDGLPSTDAHALLPDADGRRVWIGTAAGIAALDTSDGRVHPVAPVGDVRALAVHDGRLVAGTWGSGVVALDPATAAVIARSTTATTATAEASRVTSLAAGGSGLLVGTAGAGLFVWDGTALRAASPLADPYVTAIGASDGRVLVGTLAGVIDADSGVRVSSVEARALVAMGGAFWAATMGEGVQRVGGDRGDPLLRDVTTALGVGGDVMCAGTDDGLYVRRGGVWVRAADTGLPSNDVAALAWDGGRLWAGTFDRGLAVLERGGWTAVEGLDARVNALAVERTALGRRVWVATARGLASVEDGVVRVLRRADGLPDDDVHAVAPLSAGGVVVGTARGAVIVREGRVLPVGPKRLPVHATFAVAEAADGALWLGTTSGLFRVRGERFRRFALASGDVPDDWVTALAVDGAALWVGTYAGGVARIATDARGRDVGRTALADVHVNAAGLSVHGGRVYVATMEGLFVGGGGAFQRVADAAPGPDVTAVVYADGARWVASRNGLGTSR